MRVDGLSGINNLPDAIADIHFQEEFEPGQEITYRSSAEEMEKDQSFLSVSEHSCFALAKVEAQEDLIAGLEAERDYRLSGRRNYGHDDNDPFWRNQ